jgi:hypothetical protein
MKQTRLLEIIREEISSALNEIEKGEIELPKGTPPATFKQYTDKGFDVKIVDPLTGKMVQKESESKELEEDTLNEEPFIDSAFDVTGTSPENLNQDSLQKAIDDAVKVLQQENPDADIKKLAGELQKVNSKKNLGPDSKLSSELKNALQKVANVIEKQGQIFGSTTDINNLMKLAKDPSQVDRLEKLKEKGYTFILGNPQAVTAIEKSLGLKPKNNDSLLSTKSKLEKPAKEKSPEEPKIEKTPKAKVATRTPEKDGMDDVSSLDVDSEDKEATQNIGKDKTAKDLGNISSRKDKIVKVYQELKPQVDDKISQANAGDKKAKEWLKNTWTPILKAYNKAKEVKI